MMYLFKQGKNPIQKLKDSLTVLCLVFFTVLFVAPASYASGSVIKVGYADCDGIVVDEQGNHSGYAVSYLNEVSKYTGWEYEYILDSWKNCMDRLERGDLDFLVMTLYTEERGERFLFSELSMGQNYAVLYTLPDSNIFYQDYAAFQGCRIGVASETFFAEALSAHIDDLGLTCEIVQFSSEREAKEAVLRGEIDMMAASVLTLYTDMKLVDRFYAAPSYVAITPKRPELMEQINAAMQQITIENPNLESSLVKQYYSVSQSTTNLRLTREEQMYLNTVGPVVVKGVDNSKPMTYIGADGTLQGILVDYLNQLGEMSGIEFVYEVIENADSADYVETMSEEGYVLFGMSRMLEDRTQGLTLYQSDTLFDTTLAYVRRQGEFVSKYGEHTFALNENLYYVADLLKETNVESSVLVFDTSEACMESVMKEEADMAILDSRVAAYLLQKPMFSDSLTRVAGSGAYVGGVCIYAPEQHRLLISILNKTLEHISEQERIYMVDNATLSHTYEYQVEDIWYSYDTIIVMSCLSLMAILSLGAALNFRITRSRIQKKEADALRLQLRTDQLTGLYSREYFFEKVQEMICQEIEELYLIRLNVCHFKIINEMQGAEIGDRLLKEIADGLKEISQQYSCPVSRFSADYFYLCIRRNDFERINFSGKISVEWLSGDVTLVYGVYPVEKESTVHAMCDRANMAITFNRQKTAEFIYYYDDAFRQQMILEQEIASEMEAALLQRQFCIYIQPKFDVATEKIVGGESLVRWLHPQKGMIPPGIFIDVFEKNGFILKLDYYVWEESCRFMAEAKKRGISSYPLSVNVSRIHFYNTGLEDKLVSLIRKYHLSPEDLELEITENIYAEDPEIIFKQCEQLQLLGFKIAMDDFGSGYSSLNMLKRMPLDIIKMDLKFLSDDSNAVQAKKGQDILRTQIELAHTLDIKVVVEGLETEEQKNFARDVGNCTVQGYYYSKPVDSRSYMEMLERNRA